MNRSKDLRNLFRESLKNARNHITTSSGSSSNVLSVHRIPNQYEREIQFSKEIRIYFYEWSDITKAPRTFYNVDGFDNFLKTSGIFMAGYQREIILNIGTVYVACYLGTKNLNIRSTYRNLLDSMNEYEHKQLIPKINGGVNSPKLIFEDYNTMPQNDGSFFG